MFKVYNNKWALSVHALIFCCLVDEKIKLKVLACSFEITINFENLAHFPCMAFVEDGNNQLFYRFRDTRYPPTVPEGRHKNCFFLQDQGRTLSATCAGVGRQITGSATDVLRHQRWVGHQITGSGTDALRHQLREALQINCFFFIGSGTDALRHQRRVGRQITGSRTDALLHQLWVGG